MSTNKQSNSLAISLNPIKNKSNNLNDSSKRDKNTNSTLYKSNANKIIENNALNIKDNVKEKIKK